MTADPRFAILALLLVLVSPTPARGQRIDLGLERGKAIRAVSGSRRIFEARVDHYDVDRQELCLTSGECVAVAAIDSLWVQRNAGAIGAGVGALVGLLPGLAVAGRLCGLSEPGEDCTGARLLLGAIGGGVGALLGLGIGRQIRHWDLHYTALPRVTLQLHISHSTFGLGMRLWLPPGWSH
jgi:hypothetical protein